MAANAEASTLIIFVANRDWGNGLGCGLNGLLFEEGNNVLDGLGRQLDFSRQDPFEFSAEFRNAV